MINRTWIYDLLAAAAFLAGALSLAAAVEGAEPPKAANIVVLTTPPDTLWRCVAQSDVPCRWGVVTKQFASVAIVVDPDGRGISFAAAAGEYVIISSTVAESYQWQFTPVVLGTPGPNPQPQPQPSGKVAYLYWIHETADSSPAVAAVRNAKAWRDAADKAGIKWLILDVDQAGKLFPNVATRAKSAGLPALVGLTAKGDVVAGEKAPATADAMLQRVQSMGGGK